MASVKLVEEENFHLKGEDISPDQDKCLMKEIVRQGIDDDKPMFDDQVFIHYVGSEMDGTVFINSRDRNEKFSFSLGRREVIQAWDLGVATMKRGEIARFFSKPKYAYGLKGENKRMGSATNVIFEIELLDFVGKDLSDGKDGSIIRRIIRRGEGCESPNEDATVEINLKGMYQDKIFDERTVRFFVGLGFLEQVPSGVEHAVCKMLKNEHCQLDLKGKLLVGLEKFSIPIDGSVRYEVELINFERFVERRFLDAQQKLKRSELLKARADDLLKNGYHELAVKRYQIVADFLSSVSYHTDDDRVKSQQLKLAAQSNSALCYLKLGDYQQCKTSCDSGLALDAINEKCFFRRAQAQLALLKFDLALKDFQFVVKINPSNLAAQQQIEHCHQEIKKREMKQKELYKSFFK
ncbi:unnamed protein product [Rotaria socialis]|uniref:peptidylprolyl isomerase n=1 Tax=Rotaria socialis TaxID=392032 RepID=A0A821AMK6_9BILA|nr:unnamed protein product [Rotaria socialis]CAF4578305.1 unnamed protein product [Rotaria socialis]